MQRDEMSTILFLAVMNSELEQLLQIQGSEFKEYCTLWEEGNHKLCIAFSEDLAAFVDDRSITVTGATEVLPLASKDLTHSDFNSPGHVNAGNMPGNVEWDICEQGNNFRWMQMIEPEM